MNTARHGRHTVTRYTGDLWASTRETRQAYATAHGDGTAQPLGTGLWMSIRHTDGTYWTATDDMVRRWAWRVTGTYTGTTNTGTGTE